MQSTRTGDHSSAPAFLKLLADDTRWRLIDALRHGDWQAGELVALLRLPQNLVSYHLGLLRAAGIAQVRRSDADARAVYYALDIAALQSGYRQIGADMRLPDLAGQALPAPATVVFLCTGNSARSQIAEGWLRHLSHGYISARSAGTQPRALHPLAAQVMAEAGVDIGYQQAKGLDALAQIKPDLVVTVCDLAREQCPDWPDAKSQLHWSILDPVRIVGDPDTQADAFRRVRDELRRRVEGLLALLH